MNVLTISVTEPGRRLAERLPYEHAHGAPAAVLERRWHDVDAFVVVLALGAVVRLVAPLLSGKATDPAVVCMDDAGRFAIAVCGGHAGGANALAAEVAGLVGAEPVITTATDRLGLPGLDLLPGVVAEGDVAAVTSALISGQAVELERHLDWPLGAALEALVQEAPAGNSVGSGHARIVVSDRDPIERDDEPVVALRPPSLVVGLGTTTGATEAEAIEAVAALLASTGHSPHSLATVATIDRRRGHRAIVAVARRFGLSIRSFAAELLDRVAVPTPSDIVAGAVGTRSVAEAAALSAAGPGAELVVAKTVAPTVTVALARRARPAGALTLVGLGPGDPAQRTPEASTAVRHAEVVIGLDAYVAQCADLLSPAQEVRRFPIGAEIERVRLALDLAASGRRVALVCSGDAGIYAMASPALELADPDAPGSAHYRDVEISVIPGVSAGVAAAALLGAPIGHDFLTVSFSDLLTPWATIEARIRAAAQSDLVLVVYNPRSEKRTWQIEKAKALLLEHRPAVTPVGIVADASRAGEAVALSTLGELDCDSVNMTTCLVIGCSTTRVIAGRMVTPRGYPA